MDGRTDDAKTISLRLRRGIISWDNFIENDQIERKISPFGKMNVQIADMSTNTDISLHSLEKEFNFLESLQPTKKSPEYWHNLGSSKSRNAQQEKLSREIIEDLIGNCDAETAVGFTDGSCLGNPGPCGAGACLFVPGAVDPIMLKQPVSNRGSILLAALALMDVLGVFTSEIGFRTPKIQRSDVL